MKKAGVPQSRESRLKVVEHLDLLENYLAGLHSNGEHIVAHQFTFVRGEAPPLLGDGCDQLVPRRPGLAGLPDPSPCQATVRSHWLQGYAVTPLLHVQAMNPRAGDRCSLPARKVRSFWGIENRLHWSLDVCFR